MRSRAVRDDGCMDVNADSRPSVGGRLSSDDVTQDRGSDVTVDERREAARLVAADDEAGDGRELFRDGSVLPSDGNVGSGSKPSGRTILTTSITSDAS